jgi:N-methylhydantoinase A
MLLGVDVGGTFTDAVAVTPAGRVHSAKVPTTPEDQAEGVMRAIAAVLARAEAQPGQVARLVHGMTVATNALLEGRVARTALVATEGMSDVVELGRQARAHLYRLCETNPKPLAEPGMRFEAAERMGPEGVVWKALDAERARELVERVAACAPEAVAVVLLHSYADPTHERMLGELLEERMPGVSVSLSSELVGTFREYERAATTEVDAALGPLLEGYLKRLSARTRALGLGAPEIMGSSGGTIEAERAARHAALTVLSGPAGGAGGASLLAELAGERDVVCVDMGGTSCDVCAIARGRVAETAQRKVAGRPLALPALDIHTVGAGGGSIAWRDAGGALRVGPESAGARPGPACYGRGGERPTVTDANLLLGRLPADAPLAGGVRLDGQAAQRAVARLAAALGLETLACAEGIVRVAEAEMAGAVRAMTVARGVDPRAMALMAFGGAGPLHAAAIAGEMGMRRIICPRASGVLSALGLAAAPPRRDAARTVMLKGEAFNAERVRSERDELIRRVRAELAGEGFEEGEGRGVASELAVREERRASDVARVRVVWEMRYAGQSFELGVQAGEEVDPAALRESFAQRHEERYGYREEESEVELVTIRVSAWGEAPALEPVAAAGAEPERETRGVVFEGRELQAECLRGELPPGTHVAGPMVCALGEATLWVAPGWAGEVDAQGSVRLEAEPARAPRRETPWR